MFISWGQTIAIPLRAPFDDVSLDLQAAFTDAYHRGGYATDIEYKGSCAGADITFRLLPFG